LKKIFTSLRSIIPVPNGKTKFCKTCGNTATQEALFNVDGDITVIERYCETCAIKKMHPLESRN
jgi:MinD superfamily P-loop ATPase